MEILEVIFCSIAVSTIRVLFNGEVALHVYCQNKIVCAT